MASDIPTKNFAIKGLFKNFISKTYLLQYLQNNFTVIYI